MRKLVLITAASLLTACSTTLPMNYIPASTIKGSGQVTVGTIHYIPAEHGDVEPDQFQEASAALGDMHTSEPVADLIKNALRKELIAGGFSVEPGSKTVIEADVSRFLYDWIGFVEVDFYMDIEFRMKKDGVLVFAYKASAHQKAPKTMVQDTEAIRASISKCIDDFFLEAHSKRLL